MPKQSSRSKSRAKTHPRKPSAPFFPKLKKGERHVGILLDAKAKPTAFLVLLPGENEKCTWSEAKDWAKKVGGDLPTRQEQALLFANAKREFQSAYYWSGEQRASGSVYAWFQFFDYGGQSYDRKDDACRARAVRRLVIE